MSIVTMVRNRWLPGLLGILRSKAPVGYGEEAGRRQRTEVKGPDCWHEIVKRTEVAWPDWSDIDEDVFHSIMLKLQEVSVIKSSAVCKRWNCMITCETFQQLYSKQLVFPFAVKGSRYFFQHRNAVGKYKDMQPFGSSEVPYLFPAGGDTPCQEGAGGLFYFFTGNILHYKLNLVQRKWFVTPQMNYRRFKPIVGVIRTRIDGADKVVVAGGSPDIVNKEHLSVEIYDSAKGIWEVGSSLPSIFRGHESCICPAVYDDKFYVFDRKRMFCSILDLNNDAWSTPVTIRPVDENMDKLTYRKDHSALLGLVEHDGEIEPAYLVENSAGLSLVAVNSYLLRNYWGLITALIDKPNSWSRDFCFRAWNVDPLSLIVTNQTHHTIGIVHTVTPPRNFLIHRQIVSMGFETVCTAYTAIPVISRIIIIVLLFWNVITDISRMIEVNH